jgi:hypothetical protein
MSYTSVEVYKTKKKKTSQKEIYSIDDQYEKLKKMADGKAGGSIKAVLTDLGIKQKPHQAGFLTFNFSDIKISKSKEEIGGIFDKHTNFDGLAYLKRAAIRNTIGVEPYKEQIGTLKRAFIDTSGYLNNPETVDHDSFQKIFPKTPDEQKKTEDEYYTGDSKKPYDNKYNEVKDDPDNKEEFFIVTDKKQKNSPVRIKKGAGNIRLDCMVKQAFITTLFSNPEALARVAKGANVSPREFFNTLKSNPYFKKHLNKTRAISPGLIGPEGDNELVGTKLGDTLQKADKTYQATLEAPTPPVAVVEPVVEPTRSSSPTSVTQVPSEQAPDQEPSDIIAKLKIEVRTAQEEFNQKSIKHESEKRKYSVARDKHEQDLTQHETDIEVYNKEQDQYNADIEVYNKEQGQYKTDSNKYESYSGKSAAMKFFIKIISFFTREKIPTEPQPPTEPQAPTTTKPQAPTKPQEPTPPELDPTIEAKASLLATLEGDPHQALRALEDSSLLKQKDISILMDDCKKRIIDNNSEKIDKSIAQLSGITSPICQASKSRALTQLRSLKGQVLTNQELTGSIQLIKTELKTKIGEAIKGGLPEKVKEAYESDPNVNINTITTESIKGLPSEYAPPKEALNNQAAGIVNVMMNKQVKELSQLITSTRVKNKGAFSKLTRSRATVSKYMKNEKISELLEKMPDSIKVPMTTILSVTSKKPNKDVSEAFTQLQQNLDETTYTEFYEASPKKAKTAPNKKTKPRPSTSRRASTRRPSASVTTPVNGPSLKKKAEASIAGSKQGPTPSGPAQSTSTRKLSR